MGGIIGSNLSPIPPNVPEPFFEAVLRNGKPRLDRIHGLRPNASSASHAELDRATELIDGNSVELGRRYGQLVNRLKHLNVVGECCGTDHRHIQEIVKACIRR